MEEEDYIKEKDLENVGDIIYYELIEFIFHKIKNQICQIECKEGGY